MVTKPNKHPYALLGLDVGGVNSRVSLIGISDGRYRLLGSGMAPTSLGLDLHIGSGIGQAMQTLQVKTDHLFLDETGGLLMPVDRIGRGLDRVGLVFSPGRKLNTALFSLSAQGSLRAARALADSLPLATVAQLDYAQPMDEQRAIELLLSAMPEAMMITGGEEQGATEPLHWMIEIVRTLCGLLSHAVRPLILYAGNSAMALTARERLERLGRLQVMPNLQPASGSFDLMPTKRFLEGEILRSFQADLTGSERLSDLTENLQGLTGCGAERILRWLSQVKAHDSEGTPNSSLLSVDLGGLYTTLTASQQGVSGTVMLDKFPDLADPKRIIAAQAICDWSDEPISLEEADQFLCNHALLPRWVPDTQRALSLSLAYARHRLQAAMKRFAANHDWFAYHPERGLQGHFEPVIASGATFTQAPSTVDVLLALLDGLQPRQITTIVLDRYHLLPLLAKFGEVEPVVPVHLLSSPAFENLGSIISLVGYPPRGKPALTVHVSTETGLNFSREIQHSKLTRLNIPQGGTAVLELIPHRQVDIGFGGPGQGGRVKVVGGVLGLVIDARGRPLQLPDRSETRIELL
ncbi:MAG: hypothetical protein GX142_09045, partial [Chloroflexi bacterium]|nr:hypothetical protein [Chloroflexota bacterium]